MDEITYAARISVGPTRSAGKAAACQLPWVRLRPLNESEPRRIKGPSLRGGSLLVGPPQEAGCDLEGSIDPSALYFVAFFSGITRYALLSDFSVPADFWGIWNLYLGASQFGYLLQQIGERSEPGIRIGSPQNLENFLHTAGRVPLVPIKHKSCRPSQIQAPWLSCKVQSKVTHDAGQALVNSNDSENDLAALVHDFMENEFCGHDGYDSSEKESGTSSFAENLKAAVACTSFVERDLRSAVIRALFSMSEERDAICHGGVECKGRCIRYFLVKRLRAAGYDAGICKCRWQPERKVPGGVYEYIDVETAEERLIVDLDFQSHFEIARPIQHYIAALRLLPTVFIGSSRKLRQILQIMSDAAKCSLKQNSMHLPPWRTLVYMSAKWFSPYEREAHELVRPSQPEATLQYRRSDVLCRISDNKGCCEQLKRTKASLRQEVDKYVLAAAQSRARHTTLRRGSC